MAMRSVSGVLFLLPVKSKVNCCSCQRGKLLGLAQLPRPTSAAESLLFRRNWTSSVSLSEATCLETAQQLLWRWLCLLSLCSSPARSLLVQCQQKGAEMWRWQNRGTKYLSVRQQFEVAQEIAGRQQVWVRQRRKSGHTGMFRIRQSPERTGWDVRGPGCWLGSGSFCGCGFAVVAVEG